MNMHFERNKLMKTVQVNPVCGFTAVIKATTEDGQMAKLEVETQCGYIQKLAETLGAEVDGYAVCFCKCGNGPVYDAARETCRHGAYPVPAAIVKCIEAECGLALPRDVEIRFI
jgi:hypothetical protein